MYKALLTSGNGDAILLGSKLGRIMSTRSLGKIYSTFSIKLIYELYYLFEGYAYSRLQKLFDHRKAATIRTLERRQT